MAAILCIDDDPVILQLHNAVLAGSDYTVPTVLVDLNGIGLTRNHSIDAIREKWPRHTTRWV